MRCSSPALLPPLWFLVPEQPPSNARLDRQGLGAKWLREWCARASTSAAAASADDSAALAVARALLSAASGDELAAQLYNLFGDATDLQAVQELVELR